MGKSGAKERKMRDFLRFLVSGDFGLYGEVVSGDNVGVKKALGYLANTGGNCMR